MAINKKQAELIGVFKGLPAQSGYFTNKFKGQYLTIAETILFDEVASELATLNIVPRGTELPVLDGKGFSRKSVKPDVLGGKSALTTTELLEIQAGQLDLSNGVSNNYQSLIDKHVTTLKNAYYNTVERMCASAYLTGKFTLPVSGEDMDFSYKSPESITFGKDDLWELFILNLVDKYNKENGVYPELIEVAPNIFKAMLSDSNVREMAKVYGSNNTFKVNDNVIPSINIMGYTVVSLPTAMGVDGKAIDVTNQIILSNTSTLVKAYTGIGYANGNKLEIYKGEYLLNEIVKQEPAVHYFTFESGFVPIVALPERIKRYKVTIS